MILQFCSPFFEKIFGDHPCKHPVIVLKDFPGREVSALIDFMYRGEVRVGREDLAGLMRAAESLQVRGLAGSETLPVSPPISPATNVMMGEPSTPEDLARQGTPEEDDNASDTTIGPRIGFSKEHRLSHSMRDHYRELRECSSPLIPRRKQARPRRRSGELVPQDLSRPHPVGSISPPPSCLNLSNNQSTPQREGPQQQQPQEEMAENLSMKKSSSPIPMQDQPIKTESESASSPRGSPLTGSLHQESMQELPGAASLTAMSALSMASQGVHHNEYLANLGHLAQWIPNHHSREGSPHGRPPPLPPPPPAPHPFQQQESRRSVVFPMDGVSPLFPHGANLDRNSLLADLHDSFKPESLHGLFGNAALAGAHTPVKKAKKHRNDSDAHPRRWSDHGRGLPVGRPKGQHSAPRGGPPRSWTNAELTEALQHVWNKKMTTSQASRIFGIPYNSLLMYVRGKYGKSLKLEQLRRDCTGATTGEVMNSLNNNVKTAVQPPQMPPHPLGLPHQHPGDDGSFPHPLLAQNFFPEFSAAFPVPVNMVHLLPPSEQNAFEPGNLSSNNGTTEHQPRSRSPSPMHTNHDIVPPQPPQSAPALLQQNGSD